MKPRNLYPILIMIVLVVLLQACAGTQIDQTVTVIDDELGLSKESVFSTPDPIVAMSTRLEPGENELLGAYFSKAPPLIAHNIEDLLPIMIDENYCMGCHELYDEIGDEVAPEDPTPMPISHYTDKRHNPGDATPDVVGAYFVCTQCHVPQTDAAPLVPNTYRQ
ncbi:MAG: nitrate reductase cytochrome c-type subunit [Acidobacteriota bacterium]|nr:nitrate reductase cytochrome c-type subunit [Acidobacteriota bacterium]MDH3783795.1 nitrate reductase cytochrome c-type subunit [Acidobacteriota bacterium]